MAGEKGTEWIAPNWMMQNPVIAAQIENLEKIRTNKISVNEAAIPQFTSGGFSSPSPSFSSNVKFEEERNGRVEEQRDENSNLIKIIEQNTQAMTQLKNMKIYTSIEDIEKGRKNFTQIINTRGL